MVRFYPFRVFAANVASIGKLAIGSFVQIQGMYDTKQKHLGSKFEEFLAEDGILEDCRAAATKRQEKGDIAEANRREKESSVPLAKVRKRLRL